MQDPSINYLAWSLLIGISVFVFIVMRSFNALGKAWVAIMISPFIILGYTEGGLPFVSVITLTFFFIFREHLHVWRQNISSWLSYRWRSALSTYYRTKANILAIYNGGRNCYFAGANAVVFICNKLGLSEKYQADSNQSSRSGTSNDKSKPNDEEAKQAWEDFKKEETDSHFKREAHRAREEARQANERARRAEENSANNGKSTPPPDSRSAYEILGVTPSDSKEKIKKAYKEKIQKYHPDKHPNRTEDMLDMMNEEVKKIIRAYKEIS